MPTKFVIVGVQRTGTTWIRTTLDNHPSIQALGEVFLYSHGRFPIRRTAGLEIDKSYGEYVERSLRRRFMHFVNRQAIVAKYLDQLFAGSGFEATGFKLMRSQARQFPTIVRYLRQHHIRIIHVVRDNTLKTFISRETAKRRNLYHARSDVPIQQITVQTKGLIGELAKIDRENLSWQRIFGESPYIRVTYEAFVDNRNTELSRLFSFLSVEPDYEVSSPLVKINPPAIREVVANYPDVARALKGTPYESCLAG